jgi:sulfur-carrier protein adenylyltransferase/sulfurtransferase
VVGEISVQELKARRDSGEQPFIVDVREGWELEVANIPGVTHIPMGEIQQRLAELSPDRETIVMCRSGGRSMQVARFLATQGFGRVFNLKGGILAWSADIDPNVPTY